MAQLQDFDFTGYLIDPTLPDKKLEDAVKDYEEFNLPTPGIKKGVLVRYIVLMYDKATEMNQIFKDHYTRKRECAILAGFKMDEYKFSTEIEDILIGKNEEVNMMIVKYVRLFNDPDYIVCVSYWNMLLHEIHASLSTTKIGKDQAIEYKDSKDFKVTRENIDNLNKHIAALSTNIFRGDKSQELRKALYKTMEREKLILRPEDYAKQITQEALVVNDPYYPEK